jgi:hypothetical protein
MKKPRNPWPSCCARTSSRWEGPPSIPRKELLGVGALGVSAPSGGVSWCGMVAADWWRERGAGRRCGKDGGPPPGSCPRTLPIRPSCPAHHRPAPALSSRSAWRGCPPPLLTPLAHPPRPPCPCSLTAWRGRAPPLPTPFAHPPHPPTLPPQLNGTGQLLSIRAAPNGIARHRFPWEPRDILNGTNLLVEADGSLQ